MKNQIVKLVLRIAPGQNKNDAILEAITLSIAHQTNVEFEFNGSIIFIEFNKLFTIADETRLD